MQKIKRILVTGGAGYIGSHVVHSIADLGYKVTVFDNLTLGLEENIDKRAEFIKGDILNNNDLNRAFSVKIDVVFHFAALKAAGESMDHPEKYSRNNISGTLNLLNKMVEKNTSYMVFSSSAAVYGNPKYLPIDEKHPVSPINYYGYTKLVIEDNLGWYSKLKNLNFSTLRYFNATGYDIHGRIKGKEKNATNLTPVVMETISGAREEMQVFGNDYDTPDGSGIRDYIHVNDLADAHILAMNYISQKRCNLIVNLGTGRGYSVFEIIKITEKISGKKINYKVAPRRKGDPAEVIADCKLAKKLLNWQAKYSDMETIIKTMCEVYKQ
jgi:UDP-glucose 4-epimerase